MICSKCKKNIAVVFMSRMENGENVNDGLCLKCAKELGIPQVETMMKNMGITDEDIDMMGQELMDIAEDGDAFELGGAETMPPFLQNIFGKEPMAGMSDEKSDTDEPAAEKKVKDKKSKKDKKEEPKYKFLGTYCTDLTKKAKDGKLDRIIGRDKEIYRVEQILSRRTKNNPCLIGEPGVGKTAIAEGIAQKIIAGKVPFRLMDKQVFLLDLTALVAGTQFRGQFESRVKGLIDEVKDAGNIILFIDEVHTLVGTGDSEGSMSAANILKPALSRGEIQVIGATTFDEYRKNIEKDAALERRFQPVTISEPNIEDTYQVLLGIKEYYELHHKVNISNDLLRNMVVMSERYINDRFLPDKAIDLLDESCACASLASKELTEQEKLHKKLQTLTEEEVDLESDTENMDYEAIAKVKAQAILVKEELEDLAPKTDNIQVTMSDIAKVIELWTGIPADKIKESELGKISMLSENIKSKIIGQDEAVDLVVKAIKRTRVQLNKRRRPASFIFVGPTGVGKTELVKVLASELFDTIDPLIRLDMSEFMEKHAVSRLVGSPPGYVGYDEAGQLTEKVRRKPYSVILFDEIEKAHPDMMNILLQILDEGKITDSHGRTVNFENTVIAMTSNAGSSDKSGIVGFNKGENEIAKEKAFKALSDFLRPEFLGRVDEVVVFSALSDNSLEKISALMLDEMIEPLGEKGIKLKYDSKTLKLIVKKSKGGKFSARDLRKTIRKEIEDKIASLIIEKGDEGLSLISISTKGEEFVVA